VQCQGMGALRSNTLMIGWPTDPARAEAFGATLRTVAGLHRSLIAVRFKDEPEDPWIAPPGTIDVWWRGRQNGSLMLLLAHLLTKTAEWRNRPIRIMRIIENSAGAADVKRHLVELANEARITAIPHVIVATDAIQAIQDTSRRAALVLMGFEAPDEGDERDFFDRMERWSGDLPRVVFVDSLGEMSLES